MLYQSKLNRANNWAQKDFTRGQNSTIGTVPFSMHRNRPVQSGASNFQSAARYPFALVLGGILYTKTSFLMRRALSTSSILVCVYWNRKYRIVSSLIYIRLVCFVVAEIFLSHFTVVPKSFKISIDVWMTLAYAYNWIHRKSTNINRG